jgi:hypothetical protein
MRARTLFTSPKSQTHLTSVSTSGATHALKSASSPLSALGDLALTLNVPTLTVTVALASPPPAALLPPLAFAGAPPAAELAPGEGFAGGGGRAGGAFFAASDMT